VTMPAVSASLTFSSPAMLGFLVAAVVPWLIARWHQPPMRPVGLATTSLVLQAARRQAPWQRPLVRLLPLLRTLLIVAAVVAAAGPAWQPPPRPASALRTAVVVDDSADGRGSTAVVAAIDAVAESAALEPAWRATRITSAALVEGGVPPETDIVVVADGNGGSRALRSTLATWTAGGGGLLMLLGPESLTPDAAALRTWIATISGVEVGGLATDLEASLRSVVAVRPSLPAVRGPSVSSHAVLAPGNQQTPLRRSVRQSPLTTLLETSSGSSPLLVVCGVGQGRMAVSALPWTLPERSSAATSPEAWSDLAAWPVFLDVVTGLFETLAPPALAEPLASQSAAPSTLAAACLLAALLLVGLEAVVAGGHAEGRHTA